MATIGLPMGFATASIATCVVYLLTVNGRLMNQVSDKRDPFSNTTLLVLLLVFCDLQRVAFKIAIYIMLTQTNTKKPKLMVLEIIRMRYALM